MGTVVTLLTDFGTVDGFVGAMKGVILARAPEAQLVDLTHEISAQDVRSGAWALREAAPWFPRGTIHLSVVDPGVGTQRRPLLLRGGGQLFVGPDNGLLSLACGGSVEGWCLDRPQWFCPEVSDTFHGRDLFAAVAGHLAAGVAPEQLGSRIHQWVQLEVRPPRREQGQIVGEVVHVDRFGNLITNIDRALLGDGGGWQVALGTVEVGPIRRAYGDVPPGHWVAYVGSGGALEIAVCRGRAAEKIGRAPVEVILCKSG